MMTSRSAAHVYKESNIVHLTERGQKTRPVRPIGQVIHTDLCSPMNQSLGGAYHFMCLTDECSKFRRVYFLRSKDEAPDIL